MKNVRFETEYFDCHVSSQTIVITWRINKLKNKYVGYDCDHKYNCTIARKNQKGDILDYDWDSCPINTIFISKGIS